MRVKFWSGAIAVFLGATVLSCMDTPVSPRLQPDLPGLSVSAAQSAGLPAVRFSELHYDNAGTDAGEQIEISGPAGTDLTGWTVLLYNGSNGTVYNTTDLSGPIPATCGSRGVVVVSYPANGIQNGSPDGMALVDASGGVVEFLSYEGTLTAVGGAADGLTSTDIGVDEPGTTDIGNSLARDGLGVWHAPAANTFGTCNDTPIEVGPVATVRVTPAAVSLAPGETQQFVASAFDADGNPVSDAAFQWASGAPAGVSVGQSTGLATALSAGEVAVTATADGISANATVHVKDATAAATHISELHYDNVSTDAGEAVEIEGPAGTNLSGWGLLLYNGNDGAPYETIPLSGSIPATCGSRGVAVVAGPDNGIQNGPDGVALVDAAGHVVEFLSYEGSFVATAGPAAGMNSADIGVEEGGTTPVGYSLQRGATGAWFGAVPESFGACNPAPAAPAPIVINELMADPLHASGGASYGEWFEVYNSGADAIDLEGWTIVSDGQPDHVIASNVVVAPGGYAVLGRADDMSRNGGVTVNYNYFTGNTGTTIFLDGVDYLALHDANGATVDSVRWTSSRTMVKSVTRALRSAASNNADVDGSNWGYSSVAFGDGDFGTPGAANGTLTSTPPAIPNSISFVGRLSSDPALPVGFEDQLFANLIDGTGQQVSTTFTWVSETPTLASIDNNGVMHALRPGTATFRATAADGTTATYSLPMDVATASTTARYGNNTEFGAPTDADASNDFIVRRAQYTTSFNSTRGTPNWVSYDLEATHFGTQVDRCDCFTFDPELPSSYTHISTADYTGAGAAAGYGIDRGHLARSFDRTAGELDNATTYYFSNIIPQAADMNQGPWAVLENYLGDLARNDNREVYIVAGPAGNKGTVKGEGKLVIPTYAWKVAVIMPRDAGLADVHSYTDVQVIAVIMPNEPGVRDVPWETYTTTVDAVETLSGYDLLSLLPDRIERIVESGIKPPVAAINGPYNSAEGSAVSMSAAGSSDPNGSIVAYAWSFGDGGTAMGSGASVSHSYTQDGEYAVRLIVTDNDGLADTLNTTAHVANVAPTVASFAGATLLPGETYTALGSFTDPGADSWTGTVDYGDGSGTHALALTGKSYSLSHVYSAAGTFTVRVSIADDDVASAQTQTVVVITPLTQVGNVIDAVQRLADGGTLPTGTAKSLRAKLDAAARQIGSGNNTPAVGQLNALLNELEAMVKSGRLSDADASAIRLGATRAIRALQF